MRIRERPLESATRFRPAAQLHSTDSFRERSGEIEYGPVRTLRF
jgi:hypothetical protein